jgi:hypothetical protein
MFVLVIIGFDPNNRLQDAPGEPLASDDILHADGSHGCSHCETGKVLTRTPKGVELAPTDASELFVLPFANEAKAQAWAQRNADALDGKTVYGCTPNYPGRRLVRRAEIADVDAG